MSIYEEELQRMKDFTAKQLEDFLKRDGKEVSGGEPVVKVLKKRVARGTIRGRYMREVIILGSAPSGIECPFDAEVWGLNDVCVQYAGRHFDKLIVTDPIDNQEDIDNLKSYGIPIVSPHDYADESYPVSEIRKTFPVYGTWGLYATNTCARAIALALYLGYEKIRLYGVDQNTIGYIAAKGTVEYWIGRAHERGVIVDIQEESCLLQKIKVYPTLGICE